MPKALQESKLESVRLGTGGEWELAHRLGVDKGAGESVDISGRGNRRTDAWNWKSTWRVHGRCRMAKAV